MWHWNPQLFFSQWKSAKWRIGWLEIQSGCFNTFIREDAIRFRTRRYISHVKEASTENYYCWDPGISGDRKSHFKYHWASHSGKIPGEKEKNKKQQQQLCQFKDFPSPFQSQFFLLDIKEEIQKKIWANRI